MKARMGSTTPPKGSNVVALDGARGLVRRRPGRPRVIRPAPDVDERVYFEKLGEAADAFIEADPALVASTNQGVTEVERLDVLLQELAREQAALSWDRQRLQREGRDGAAQVSSRRVDALLKVARLVVLREEVRRTTGAMDEALVERVVGLLLVEVESTVFETATPEVATKFIGKLKARIAACPDLRSGLVRAESGSMLP
jgi:hypothetical protein